MTRNLGLETDKYTEVLNITEYDQRDKNMVVLSTNRTATCNIIQLQSMKVGSINVLYIRQRGFSIRETMRILKIQHNIILV